uniref:Uncharacterized protein n=1 Tax=Anguilla anguilla TaxID=7936 RepID=A0A0E9X328_ANGAN
MIAVKILSIFEPRPYTACRIKCLIGLLKSWQLTQTCLYTCIHNLPCRFLHRRVAKLVI